MVLQLVVAALAIIPTTSLQDQNRGFEDPENLHGSTASGSTPTIETVENLDGAGFWPLDQIFGRDELPMANDRQRLSAEDTLSLYQCMHNLHALFVLRNITYWAGGGTLLGAVRNKGVIPHDNDVDLHIPAEEKDKLLSHEFMDDLDRNGMKLVHKFQGQWGITNKSLIQRPLKHGVKLPPYIVHSDEWGYPYWIDVYAMRVEGRKVKFVQPDKFYKTRWWDLDVFDNPFVQLPFGRSTLFAPQANITKAYLDRLYGTTWAGEVNCRGTYHNCNLSTDLDWDLKHHAVPAGPLIDPDLDA